MYLKKCARNVRLAFGCYACCPFCADVHADLTVSFVPSSVKITYLAPQPTVCMSWVQSRGSCNATDVHRVFQNPLLLLHDIYVIPLHYDDVIMGAIASQINSLTIADSIVYSDADQRKQQSSASLAFVRGFHRGPVNSPHKWPVTWKCFHLMTSSWTLIP